ncbi:1,3-beta-glucan synthase component FKS1-like [Lycium barbarum]|uniref:1,3-beta-glucan synthase component FKS1-like n=1 Tax=Lycium barbarum TaxID=112863 RepID=UPI00293E7B60|nr:1,3-beta-glucan synthase component FKS1-like [Lycium barbarum]
MSSVASESCEDDYECYASSNGWYDYDDGGYEGDDIGYEHHYSYNEYDSDGAHESYEEHGRYDHNSYEGEEYYSKCNCEATPQEAYEEEGVDGYDEDSYGGYEHEESHSTHHGHGSKLRYAPSSHFRYEPLGENLQEWEECGDDQPSNYALHGEYVCEDNGIAYNSYMGPSSRQSHTSPCKASYS